MIAAFSGLIAHRLGPWGAATLLFACSGAPEGDPGEGFAGGAGEPSVGTAGSGGATALSAATAGASQSAGSGMTLGSSGRPSTLPTAGGGGAPGSSASAGQAGARAGETSTGGASAGSVAGASAGGASAGEANTGGASAGEANAGGRSAGGASAAGSGNVPAIGPGRCGCETPAGEFGTVDSTIIVRPGEVYDGECKIYRANPSTLGPGDQSEDQKPIFRVEGGGALKNVVIGASGADGIHLYGDVSLENIHWLDIGEDAMTVKASGTVRLNCGSATKGEDKVFQVNAASEIFISNFTASDAGKFMRQNGNTTFRVTVTIDHSDISDMDEVIFRTDSTTSHVTLTNSRYSRLGKGLFMFGSSVSNGNSNQSTVSNNQAY